MCHETKYDILGVYIANISKTLKINELHTNFSCKIVVYMKNFL